MPCCFIFIFSFTSRSTYLSSIFFSEHSEWPRSNKGALKRFPAEKINIFFVTFFRVEISIIGLTIGCVGSLPSRSTYKWMILNDLCSQIWNKNSYLGGCQQIKVCARKWPTTTAGIVIYIFFKKSLYSSHQRRHSEVRCASRADLHKMLWALLCCVASNERSAFKNGSGAVDPKLFSRSFSFLVL